MEYHQLSMPVTQTLMDLTPLNIHLLVVENSTITYSTNVNTISYKSGMYNIDGDTRRHLLVFLFLDVIPQASIYFLPSTCLNATQIGFNCNISARPCDLLQPCRNQDYCSNNNSELYYPYQCSCSYGFLGLTCQYDTRSCERNPCWNNGRLA